MTTMELNLRKEYLYDLIKGMDEERLSKVETYIKRFCSPTCKKVTNYPWTPSVEELESMIAESEENYEKGLYIEEEEMDKFFESMR
ncbi:hypothetical protein [Parabacteroides sp.]